jgi:hypothetical protein
VPHFWFLSMHPYCKTHFPVVLKANMEVCMHYIGMPTEFLQVQLAKLVNQ